MLVRQRNIAGVVRPQRQRYAAQPGVGGRQGVRLGVESDDAGLQRPFDPAIQIGQVADAVVSLGVHDLRLDLRRFSRGVARRQHRCARLAREGRALLGRRLAVAHSALQAPELHAFQEVTQGRRIGIAHGEVLDRFGRRRIARQPHQFAAEPDLVGILNEGVAAFRLLDLARLLQQRVEVAELVQKLRRGLRSDARRARHVVDAVADQSLQIDHLVRTHAELLDHLGLGQTLVLHGVPHDHAAPDQLHQVLVGRDDHRLAAHVAGLAGIGGDQVVGFIAGQLHAVDAERRRRLAHQGELRRQVLGRGGPVGLVLVVEIVPEGLLRMVEDGHQVGRPVGALHVAQQLPQHVAITLHRPDRQAVRLARQRRQGVIGAEDVGRGVDHPQPQRRPVLGQRAVGFGECICSVSGGVGHAPQHRGGRRLRQPFPIRRRSSSVPDRARPAGPAAGPS